MRYLVPLRSFRGCASRFRSARAGATAVEFALVSMPFFLLIAAILQWCFILWARMNLDSAVEDAVRNLYTGSFQAANAGVTNTTTILNNLKTAMCGSGANTVPTVFSCKDVKLNVSVASNFAGGSYASPYDSKTKAISTSFEGYTCAQPGQITVVTAAVSLPVFFGSLVPGLAGMSDGSYLIRSTNVFRTEPYSTVSTGSC